MAKELLVNGVDVLDYVSDRSISLQNTAFSQTGVLDFTLEGPPAAFSVSVEHEVIFRDDTTLERDYAGFIRVVEESDYNRDGWRVVRVSCQDYTTLLDDDIIATDGYYEADLSNGDKFRIEDLITTFGTKGITAGVEVQELRATMPAQDFTGMTLLDAIKEILALSGGQFYVDYDKKLHVFHDEVNAAPFGLSDAPNNTTTFGFKDLALPEESTELKNAVYVKGAPGLEGWYEDTASIAAYGRREAVIQDERVELQSTLDSYGESFLLEHAQPKRTGSLVTFTPGLEAGMTVQITSALHGLTAEEFRITSVVTTYPIYDAPVYTITFGDDPSTLAQEIGSIRYDITDINNRVANVVNGLADMSAGGANMIEDSSFENDSSDFWTVGAGWVKGHVAVDAFAGSKTARVAPTGSGVGSLMSELIPVDRTEDWHVSYYSRMNAYTDGSVRALVLQYDDTTAQIVGANIDIGAPADVEDWTRYSVHLGPNDLNGRTAFHANTAYIRVYFDDLVAGTFDWEVDAVQVERGSIITAYAPTPQELLDGSVGTTKIADNAVTTEKIIANAIVSGKIASSAVTTDKLDAEAVTANKIAANALTVTNRAAKGNNLLDNSSFEIEPAMGFDTLNTQSSDVQPYWFASTAGAVMYATSGYARTGDKVLRISGPGAWPSISSHLIPVSPGRKYRLSAWIAQVLGSAPITVRADSYGPTGASVASHVISLNSSSGVLAQHEGTYVVPNDGTVSFLRVYVYANSAAATTSDVVVAEDVALEEVPSDVENSTGEVTIDPDGITILNGKLNLIDSGGKSVISAGGFQGSWQDFLVSGIYNSSFTYGTTNTIGAATQVGGGDTDAEYIASLSDDIIGWVVDVKGGTTLRRVAAPSSGGYAVEWSGTGTATAIYQDIPVVPGETYHLEQEIYQTFPTTSSSVNSDYSLQWRTATHAPIGSPLTEGSATGGVVATYPFEWYNIASGSMLAPSDARFLRLRFNIATTNAVHRIGAVRIVRAATSLYFGNDTKLYRPSAGVLKMDVTDRFELSGGPVTRFQPVAETLIVSSSTSADIASTLVTVPGLPAGAEAVQVMFRMQTTGANSPSNQLQVKHALVDNRAGSVNSPAALSYFVTSTTVVECDSLGRIRYQVNRAAGTINFYIACVGYWTTN